MEAWEQAAENCAAFAELSSCLRETSRGFLRRLVTAAEWDYVYVLGAEGRLRDLTVAALHDLGIRRDRELKSIETATISDPVAKLLIFDEVDLSDGDVVVDRVEYVSPLVQQGLLDRLRVPHRDRARLVVAGIADIETSGEAIPSPNPELVALLAPRRLALPSLGLTRGALAAIVERVIERTPELEAITVGAEGLQFLQGMGDALVSEVQLRAILTHASFKIPAAGGVLPAEILRRAWDDLDWRRPPRHLR